MWENFVCSMLVYVALSDMVHVWSSNAWSFPSSKFHCTFDNHCYASCISSWLLFGLSALSASLLCLSVCLWVRERIDILYICNKYRHAVCTRHATAVVCTQDERRVLTRCQSIFAAAENTLMCRILTWHRFFIFLLFFPPLISQSHLLHLFVFFVRQCIVLHRIGRIKWRSCRQSPQSVSVALQRARLGRKWSPKRNGTNHQINQAFLFLSSSFRWATIRWMGEKESCAMHQCGNGRL